MTNGRQNKLSKVVSTIKTNVGGGLRFLKSVGCIARDGLAGHCFVFQYLEEVHLTLKSSLSK